MKVKMQTFDEMMGCSDGCQKCHGKCVVWFYRWRQGKKLSPAHFLIEDDFNRPFVLKDCDDVRSKYKAYYDGLVSSGKVEDFRVYIVPQVEAVDLHKSLDEGLSKFLDYCLEHGYSIRETKGVKGGVEIRSYVKE